MQKILYQWSKKYKSHILIGNFKLNSKKVGKLSLFIKQIF